MAVATCCGDIYLRASGALAGVTLKTHLSKVCKAHGIVPKKANPTISDYNEELKSNSVIDIPAWCLILDFLI
jgi:hypothetical protein